MRQNRNLYEYIYRTVVSQIECGVYRHGDVLPAQRELCRQYNAGITTIRKIFRLLEQNGYVRTSSGQQAVVAYRASDADCIAALMQRRSEVEDAYLGMGLLMPALYRRGAECCGEAELRLLAKTAAGVGENMTLPMLYRRANDFFATLLLPLHNQLALDLELDVENFLHIPYFPLPETEDPLAITPQRLKTWLLNAIGLIGQKKFDEFYANTLLFYRESFRKVSAYFDLLGRHAANKPTAENARWFRAKNRSELYVSLAINLVRRINGKEFESQKYLPSIPRLMSEYGVPKETASRAIALLRSTGIVRTIDKKGTVIATERQWRDFKADLRDPLIRRRLTLCLDALQIMALTVRGCLPATSGTAPVDEPTESAEEEQITADIGPLAVQKMMSRVIETVPYQSLKNVYRQMNELLVWGCYLLPAAEERGAIPAGGVTTEQPTDGPCAPEQAFSLLFDDLRRFLASIPATADLAAPR